MIPGEEVFDGTKGVKLYGRSWRPEGEPRAVVVLMHGFLAHSGRYQWPAEQLVRRGLAVYAFDLRGHGRSEGERYWVDRYADYVDDLSLYITRISAREAGKRVFLLGHSAGGVISAVFAQRYPKSIAGLICESFAFEVPPPEIILQALKGVASLFPNAPILKLHPKDFSRDPAVVAAITNDPLVIHDAGPAQTLGELVRAHDFLAANFGTITVPVFIIHGTEDKATRPHGSQRFFDETGSKDKTLKLYEGHYHDLLADLGKEQVMADIQDWIDKRI